MVISIMAFATAGVSLVMRDSSQTQLEREASRLAALLESARAASRASGVPVRWRPVAEGFVFEGAPPDVKLPTGWLQPGVVATTPQDLLLGPEPLIAPQRVVLTSSDDADSAASVSVATDGLHPFTVEAANASGAGGSP